MCLSSRAWRPAGSHSARHAACNTTDEIPATEKPPCPTDCRRWCVQFRSSVGLGARLKLALALLITRLALHCRPRLRSCGTIVFLARPGFETRPRSLRRHQPAVLPALLRARLFACSLPVLCLKPPIDAVTPVANEIRAAARGGEHDLLQNPNLFLHVVQLPMHALLSRFPQSSTGRFDVNRVLAQLVSAHDQLKQVLTSAGWKLSHDCGL
jgi:hypothetical protein